MTLILDPDGMRRVHRYDTARKAMAMWEDEKAAAKADLVAFLGAENGASYQGRDVLAVSRIRPKRFDQTAFAEDNPSLFEQYRREADTEEIRLILPKVLPGIPKWLDPEEPS